MEKIRKHKKLALISLSVLSILLLVTILPNSFASLTPIKSITIESEKLNYEENESGSYKITKSAEWIGKGKARITFQVDTKELIKENTNTDTILIIDISDSMTGNKMDKVKQDSIDLIQKTLQDNNNKIGIIEFNNNASIVSNLSNDVTDLTNKINNLTTLGSTNYYQALVKLDELLKTYQKEENRELTVLFLTDGLPNINTPNEVGQYKYLKSEYPYLNINGIQYEMGNTILEEVKNISDKQYIADMNTLNNVLIDASALSEGYNKFEITDYINTEHFKIDDKNAITTSTGNFILDKGNGKITWNLNGLSSGMSATMTIDIYLKDEYINNPDLYKTNIKEEVTSEINGIKENISKTDTPILSNSFTVTYDENAPDGCKVEGTLPESKQYSVFNPVKIEESNLTCDGYKFQGWEVVNKENVSMIGNSYFVSDGNDIKLKAIWSKVSLKKSMSGTVYEVKPIIKAVPYDEENWMPYQGEFWNYTYKLNTTKIIIQNELNPIEGAIQSWDVSEANDGSVMAYAVLNDDGKTYTIYLQGPGKIIANEDSSYLFCEFDKLESIEGLEYFDTSNVTNMSSMFYLCTNLKELDISDFDKLKVTNMNSMFGECHNLIRLNVSNFNTSNVTDMSYMFVNCTYMTNLNISNFNTSNVTDMSCMFASCQNLTNLDISTFDTSNVTNMSYMFVGCSSLTKLDVSNFDTSNVTNMSYMFVGCSSLTKLDVSNFDTSNVTDMSWMFYNSTNLIDLNLSTFNTSNVTDMSYMFNSCYSLTKLDVSNFDTSNVTDMMSMFARSSSLTELNVSNFDTSNVTDMSYMFSYCYSLTKLDVSNFDTSNVVDMGRMFIDCRGLTELDVSNFDTSKVANMNNMFNGCSNLHLIDFRNADFSSVTYYTNMFKNTSELNVVVKDETARTWIQGKLGNKGTAIIAS